MGDAEFKAESVRKWEALSVEQRCDLLTVAGGMLTGMPPLAVSLIRHIIAVEPLNWWVPYHFGWGMAVRNYLRKGGIDEAALPTHNLDDYYVEAVERALAAMA